MDLCGYSVPHPSEQKINFRIQTKGLFRNNIYDTYCVLSYSTGEESTVILREGLQDLSNLCEHVLETFKVKKNKIFYFLTSFNIE